MNIQNQPALKAIVELRQNMQKSRVAFGNRFSAITRGDDEDVQVTDEKNSLFILGKFATDFHVLEEKLDKFMYDQVKHEPIIKALTSVKGIGPIIATKIAMEIDITRAETVSSLWRFAGQAVFEGKAERRVKGVKLAYNSALKVLMFILADSFIKTNSPYRAIYDKAKLEYQVSRPDWTKMHIHMAARRKMIKLFLSHLYQVWRKIEGLPTRDPYVIDHTEHTTLITPEEFGWVVPIGSK